MDIQTALGADIIMVLDECPEYPVSPERARESMELSLRWARRSQEAFAAERERAHHPQALFGIVQGGMEAELRRECAQRLTEMDFPGYAIGGLAVGEPAPLSYEVAEAAVEHLPEEKPRYVMGVGCPHDIIEYVRRGVDMMDCVLPTRNARTAQLFTSEGRLSIRNATYTRDTRPPDEHCGCMVCQNYSRAYLRHLFNANEMTGAVLATYHNLHYYLDLMHRIRNAILAGTLDDLEAELRQTNSEENG
jgi:queuine tRNA-ribosyltransferase